MAIKFAGESPKKAKKKVVKAETIQSDTTPKPKPNRTQYMREYMAARRAKQKGEAH